MMEKSKLNYLLDEFDWDAAYQELTAETKRKHPTVFSYFKAVERIVYEWTQVISFTSYYDQELRILLIYNPEDNDYFLISTSNYSHQ